MNLNVLDKDIDSNVKKYLDMLMTNGYTVVNEEWTRCNKITGRHTLIDNIVLRDNGVNSLSVTSNEKLTEAFSDHNLICLVQPGRIKDKLKINSRLETTRLNKYKMIAAIRKEIPNLSINIHPEKYCNSIYAKIYELKVECTEKIVMKCNENLSSKPKWANKVYVQMSNRIYNLTGRSKKLKSENRPTDRLDHQIAQIKKQRDAYGKQRMFGYYNDKASMNNKELWQVLNELSGRTKE